VADTPTKCRYIMNNYNCFRVVVTILVLHQQFYSSQQKQLLLTNYTVHGNRKKDKLHSFVITYFSDNKVNVSVCWPGHFINKVHEEGQFLAEIEQYPIQFKDLEDDGILMSLK